MAHKPLPPWRTTLKRRLTIAAAAFLLWSGAIEARLVYLQVITHDDLMTRAERQQQRTVSIAAKRGEIVDREGRALAFSVDGESIYAVPTEIADAGKAAAALCSALADCSGKERQALTDRIRRGRAFVYVRRQASPDQARRVAALKLEGVGFVKEGRRYYPNKELASHLLGYVGIDNTGLGGLEATYDSLIKGLPGTVLIQTDARRHAFSRVEKPPTTGASLELTIDAYLQYIVERELKAGVEENAANGGAAVLMDPRSGEILAMANYPTYNPNAYREATANARRNRAIQDLYEPGSTFKIVTASAALDNKLVTPDALVNASGGSIRIGARLVRDTHDYGVLSFTDVIVKSSNVGAIRMGFKVGAQRLDEYVRKFGFGRRSSPDFPSETPGIVWSVDKLTDSALASVSMGYQIGVTPLQMAAAVSSVANGGELLQPRVVRAVIRDGVRVPVPRKVVGRTISPAVASELTAIMEQVVERGTARAAQIDGFTIAGKTGTAAQVINGRYSANNWNASFVGFVPSQDPVFTLIVLIDAPHAKGHTGGVAAAPVFKRIAETALRQYGVAPTVNAPPPVLIARRDEDPRQQTAAPFERPTIVPFPPSNAPGAVFPDLRGMNARDALRSLGRLGMTAKLHGAGLVIEQKPEPGTAIERGAVSDLWLRREAPVSLASDTQP